MKTLAFGASGSKNSINQIFAEFTAQKLSKTVENVSIVNFSLPFFSIDEEQTNGIPENAQKFYEKIKNNELIIISLAEHNGSYTAIFKNLFDWLSRIELAFFAEKKLVLLATAPGPRGGLSVLETAKERFPRHGATILGTFSLPKFQENFDVENQKIANDEWNGKFDAFIESIQTNF